MSKGNAAQSSVVRYATLSMFWGALAAAAYLLLPWVPSTTSQSVPSFVNWLWPDTKYETGASYVGALATHGLTQFNGGQSSSLTGDPVALLLFILALLIPVAIAGVILTGLFARLRVPPMTLARAHTITGFVGLLGMLSLFLTFVILNKTDQQAFLTVLGITVLTSIVGRLQPRIRQAFQQRPTLSSIGTLIIAYATFWLANQTTLPAVILKQIGLWVNLAAFAVVIYSGFSLQRSARRAKK
ncbi:MAG TPA: hypothetical protein VKB76_20970 [Ktedonobacterales bacterium]|nr:hypothetical protein [Ktedonobacterales bacterium]